MADRRRTTLLVLALVAGVCAAVAAPALAGKTTIRDHIYGRLRVALTPTERLQDNEFVRITWRGLPPLRVVFFRQCTLHPRNLARDCTAIYPDVGFTNEAGRGTMYEHVTAGDVLSQNHHRFACTHSTPCTLGVFTSGKLDSGKLLKVRFAPSLSACPAPAGAAIVGGGADEAEQAMFDWGLAMCEPPSLLGVSYIGANSQDGRQNFINGLADFAVTATPFTPAERTQLRAKHRQVTYAPVAASGLVLAYKIFDQNQAQAEPGPQVTNLRLTPALVAQIFTGQLSNWQTSAAMNTLNPHHVFPPTIFPLVRGDHSDANLLFTSWLTATAGDSLPKGWPGPSTDFPMKYLTPSQGIVGGDTLADAIAAPTSVQNSNDYFAVGYIGFIDSSQAHYYGLPEARIENAAGKFVTATPASIRAALARAHRNPDGVTVRPNFATRDPRAYPMPTVDYVTAPTAGYNGEKGATLRGFLHYAVTAGQRRLPAGYTALPPSMVAETAHVIPEIPASAVAPSAGGGTAPGGAPGSAPGGPGGRPAPTGPVNPHALSQLGGTAAPTAVRGSGVVAGVLAAGDGRLVLPALTGASLVGVLVGLGLLAAGDGRRRAVAAIAGLAGTIPRRPWRRRP